MTRQIIEPAYTAHVSVTGGRDGHAVSDDGLLNLHLEDALAPNPAGSGTNPEQLFAAAYASCFQSALESVTRRAGIDPIPSTVTAAVTLGRTADRGWALAVSLNISLPNLDPTTANQLIIAADQLCPYSHALRGNIPVTVVLVD